MFFLSSYDHFQRKLIIIAKSQGFFPWLFLLSWEQRKLGELGSVSMCKRIFKEQTTEQGDVPFFKIGTFGGKADAFISQELFEEYKAKYPYPTKGAILISASGSIGRTVEFTGGNEYFQDSNIVWLTHDERLQDTFLKYLYETVKWAGIEGSTIKRLYNDNILKTEIKLPTIAEQKQIGSFFCSLDDLITLHQHEPLFLVMLFSGGSCVFKSAWEQRKLKDICSVFTDGDWIESKDQSDQGVRLIQTGNVGVTEYLDKPNNKKWVSEDTFERLHCTEVLSGDILISRLPEPAGRACIVPKIGQKMITAVDCTIARIAPEYSSEYVVQYLSTQDYFDEVNNCLAGGTRQRISRGNLSSFLIPLPCSKAEQERIGGFFRSLDDLITLHQRKGNQREIKSLDFAWEQRKLSDLAEKTYGGGTPATSNEAFWNGSIPWIQSSDIADGKLFGVVPRKYITNEALNKSATQLVPANSLAIITRVGVGKLAFMPFSYTTSQDFLSLSKLNTEPFFTVYACYKKLQSELNAVQGTSIKGITKDELLAKAIMVPKYREQEQIGCFFRSLDNLITLHQREHKSNFRRKTNVKQSTRDRPFLLLLCSVDKGLQRGSGP